MQNRNDASFPSPGIEPLAAAIFESLASRFPVSLASDEFHFFPHYISKHRDWSRWDDFSPDAVGDTVSQLAAWGRELAQHRGAVPPGDDHIDIDMLLQVLTNLQEQFADVRLHETQPTLYLTIAGIGLAEAAESGSAAFSKRLETLPGLIDVGIANLRRIPLLYRNMGLAMAQKLRRWLLSTRAVDSPLEPAARALQRLMYHLEAVPVTDDFRLPKPLYARIAEQHMGCRMGLEAISAALEAEIDETRAILEKEAVRLAPGRSWQAVVADLAPPDASEGSVKSLYHLVISDLRTHCIRHGLASRKLAQACPVRIQEIPDYLLPVRSGAAFSMQPGHPPRGGTFFITPRSFNQRLPADYRLLAAHETFPGHHLLDASRWRLGRPARRPLEFPLFYEGWASFSEEILFDTGFFSGPVDRLLMAKRRFWRAVRGRTDLRIHTGTGLHAASSDLTREGLASDQAMAMVSRYALKPGYQLGYTLGRRRFRDIYDTHAAAGGTPGHFAARILDQGEIDFSYLEALLFGSHTTTGGQR